MKSRYSFLFVMILLVAVFAVSGCASKADVTATPEPQPQQETAAPDAAAEAAKRAAEEEAAAKAKAEAEAQERERAAAAEANKLQPVYFDFDRSFIRDDARAAMKKNAEVLKSNPGMKIKIEGNCDERGTIEYNQALGQRRASAAKKYLTDLGIAGSRISLISYGKEKQVCNESTEECWQKNRRADLVAQ